MPISTSQSRKRAARRPGTLVITTLVATLLAWFAAACSGGNLQNGLVVGSGQVTSETRQVPDFTAVEAHGGIQLELVQGDTTAVVVTAQSNLLPITTTKVDGARLVVDTTKGYTTTQGLKVTVTTPRLTAVTLAGGASGSGGSFEASSLVLDLSGGARVDLSGSVEDLTLKASGGAVIGLGDLRANTAKVDLSGGVVATLAVSSAVTGTASGGVVITLATRPDKVGVETSGGAVVVGA